MTTIDDYIETSNILRKIDENKRDFAIIHYSCESFYDKNNTSSKISSIAIRNVDDSETVLFTPYITAETLGIKSSDIVDIYELLELHMLSDYFSYVQQNEDKNWIHWNMRDRNYGFSAIEHRYKVLSQIFPDVKKSELYTIRQRDKIDLANLFVKRYGPNYVNKPKLTELYKLNKLEPKDILTGEEEAESFANDDFVKIGHSTAAKVKLIETYLTLAINKRLKVKTSKIELHGKSVQSLFFIFKSNRIGNFFIKFLSWIIPFLLGFLGEKLMDFLFF